MCSEVDHVASTVVTPDLEALAAAIDAVLPQTQCTRCGYPDCRAYADALAAATADINQCPPGGAEGIRRLAAVTGRAVLPLSAAHGAELPRQSALIDESACIGCTLCLPVCPVDSILGGPKSLHVVMASLCTGCALCLPVCPVDCIRLVPVSGLATGWSAWTPAQAGTARGRYNAHRDRAQTLAARRLAELQSAASAPNGS